MEQEPRNFEPVGPEGNKETNDSFLMFPPEEPPRWLRVGVLEYLKRQTKKLDRLRENLEEQEHMARDRFGVGASASEPMPLPKPDQTAMQKPASNIARPVEGTQGGRSTFIGKIPPATRGLPPVRRVTLV